MQLSISGLPAIVVGIGFVVVFAAPVWLAARLTGADNPTLLRSIASLIVGLVGSIASAAISGGFALLLAPLAFLLSFKFVLGTSFLGAVLLGIVALLGYAAMVHFVGGGLSAQPNGISA